MEDAPMPDMWEKLRLIAHLNKSIYDHGTATYDKILRKILDCTDYKLYEKIEMWLEEKRRPLDQITNPTQEDITKHVNRISR